MIDCPECGSSDIDVAPADYARDWWCQDCGCMFDADPDPRCVCGTARSEHALCGCPDGFQRASR